MSYYLEILESKFNGEYNGVCNVIKEAFMTQFDNNYFQLSVAIDSYNVVKSKLI